MKNGEFPRGVDLSCPLPVVPYRRDSKMAKIPTVESQGRKWKVWIVDETDVTVTVRVRPLRVKEPVEYTFPFRDEFRAFNILAGEAIDRYLGRARPTKAAHSS